MKSNKVFYIENLAFNLPDDFDGTVTDALELVIRHRKSEEAKKARTMVEKSESPKTLEDTCNKLFDNDNIKLISAFGMSFYNKDAGWEEKTEPWRYK